MKLLFIRHGIATPKKENDSLMDDYVRLLTPEGISETQDMARKYSAILSECHVLFTSALLRAVETAELLYPSTQKADFELLDVLDKVADPLQFINFIKTLNPSKTYAFVGHEPHLGESIRILLRSTFSLELRKSGILILEGIDVESLHLSGLYRPS
jgi:phosphohistidine phosphatase